MPCVLLCSCMCVPLCVGRGTAPLSGAAHRTLQCGGRGCCAVARTPGGSGEPPRRCPLAPARRRACRVASPPPGATHCPVGRGSLRFGAHPVGGLVIPPAGALRHWRGVALVATPHPHRAPPTARWEGVRCALARTPGGGREPPRRCPSAPARRRACRDAVTVYPPPTPPTYSSSHSPPSLPHHRHHHPACTFPPPHHHSPRHVPLAPGAPLIHYHHLPLRRRALRPLECVSRSVPCTLCASPDFEISTPHPSDHTSQHRCGCLFTCVSM